MVKMRNNWSMDVDGRFLVSHSATEIAATLECNMFLDPTASGMPVKQTVHRTASDC